VITIKNTITAYKFFLIVFIGIIFLNGAGLSTCQAKSIFRKKSQAGITAQAVYAVDYTNNKVLLSRNPRMKFFPASTVKLLTALVVLDEIDLKTQVRISPHAAGVAPTKAGLTCGATYAASDLLKVLLATSANDAGVALAEAAAGNEANFAVLMNKKARSLGARDSRFSNPTGLPDNRQVTTAYDLSIITRAAFSQPFIADVMRKKNITIAGSDGRNISRPNHNKLLWKLSEPCVLGKTGYTRSAGHCYAGIANYDDGRVSIVILKSCKPWLDIYKILSIAKRNR
jgi:D-alanyl-D-alanine carboxypeptidase (penicillin-binding protein 5/6)